MCGKFTAMASWREVVEYSRAFSSSPSDFESGASRDEEVTYGVAKPLPVIIWDCEAGKRRVVPMRWGFPHAKDWRRPQPIHARSETVETTKTFAQAFADGQRGIVVFKTFDEGEETTTSTGTPKRFSGRLIHRMESRAASRSCCGVLKFPTYHNRCLLA